MYLLSITSQSQKRTDQNTDENSVMIKLAVLLCLARFSAHLTMKSARNQSDADTETEQKLVRVD